MSTRRPSPAANEAGLYTPCACRRPSCTGLVFARRELALGARFFATVAATAKKLQRFPESAEIVHSPSFRRAVIPGFPYSLIYRIDGQKIVVVAVMHASRHPDTWQERSEMQLPQKTNG